ncbi:MAG: hypothetical protein WCI60_00865 [bacterium]
MEISPGQEFGKTHNLQLEVIETLTEIILDSDHLKTVVKVDKPGEESARSKIIEGLSTSEDILALADELGATITKSKSEKIAESINNDNLIIGEIAVNSILATASLYDDFKSFDYNKITQEILDGLGFLNCEYGIWTKSGIDLETTKGWVDLEIISLHGLEKYLTTTRHKVTIVSEGVSKSLEIDKIGDRNSTPEVNFKVTSENNPLFEKAILTINLEFAELIPYFSNTSTEKELNEKVSELKLRYSDSPTEEEAVDTLDAVKDRILATRSSIEIKSLFGNVNLPSIEQLDEFTAALQEIYN